MFPGFCNGKAIESSRSIRMKREVLGEQAYASLKDVPDPIDIVNIFRRPARVPEVVDDALQKGVSLHMDAGRRRES